jgi:hypothetical protein
MIQIIRTRATEQQIDDMMLALETYIKIAVDVRRRVLAGGGVLHADCKAVLLEDGSQQQDIWGADWNPASQQLTYESLINIRPLLGNRSLVIQDSKVRERVREITQTLLGET